MSDHLIVEIRPQIAVPLNMDHDAIPLYIHNKRQMDEPISVIPAGVQPPPSTILTQPIMQHTMLLGPENTVATCPFCAASIKTAVKYTTTARTHIAAGIWCVTCCMGCIPYASDSAKNTDHYCPNCNRYLGTYQK